jgi:outer membrane lipopolysaccharide assembly protein LptE/RlpB
MKGDCPHFFPENGDCPPFSACSRLAVFTCRGRQPLPAQFTNTYVETQDEQTDFVQDLRKALIASQVNVIRTKGLRGRNHHRARR